MWRLVGWWLTESSRENKCILRSTPSYWGLQFFSFLGQIKNLFLFQKTFIDWSLSFLSLTTAGQACIRKQNPEKLWVIRGSGHICYIIFHITGLNPEAVKFLNNYLNLLSISGLGRKTHPEWFKGIGLKAHLERFIILFFYQIASHKNQL